MEFDGKVALVTGASSGIGLETAKIFGKNGAKLILCDINETAIKPVTDQFESEGIDCIFVKTDIGDSKSVQNAVDTGVAKYGQIDFAANCAGRAGSFKPMAEMTDDEFINGSINTNLFGDFYLMRSEIKEFLKHGHGSIVNISGIIGQMSIPNGSELSAAGAGIEGLTRGAAIDYADKGIRVNCVAPAATYTNLTKKSFESDKTGKQLVDLVPMKRYAQPSEIANVIVFLLSDKASFMTGQLIGVNGGQSTGNNTYQE